MNEVKIEDKEPWYRHQRDGKVSRHLQVWCGSAYLLIRKSDGLTEIGYQDEETSLPLVTQDEIADWVMLMQWRAVQTFPWRGEDE